MAKKKDDETESKFENLKKSGFWFWTKKIRSIKNEDSSLNELINTRDKFMEILENESLDTIVNSLLNPEKPLAVKLTITHLMRATDGSAELLDRIKDYVIFKKISKVTILKNGNTRDYNLKAIGTSFKKKLSNEEISKAQDGLAEDIITILLFGSQFKEFQEFLTLKKLSLGKLIGDKKNLHSYFESLYLKVSRQASGISTAASGTGPQDVVEKKLQDYFKGNSNISKVSGSRIRGVGSDPNGQQFDLVYEIKKNGAASTFVAIEIAFQETTNSVIERKSKQAVQLFDVFNKKGHYLCFAVDGAGYFSRSKATKDIIKHSHLTVTFQDQELEKLCKFIEDL